MALHLPAHTIGDEPRKSVLGVNFNSAGSPSSTFATATEHGWSMYRTNPLELLSRREFPNGSLRIVLPLEQTNIVLLVGGPPSPLFPPNKVLFWDDARARTVAELEFSEDVRGLAARRDRLVVVLRRRVVIFVLGRGSIGIWREGSYETTNNPKGLVAMATAEGSSLLAFPGRQSGQVQLVHLPPLDLAIPPLPPPLSHDPTRVPYRAVSIIIAHTSALAAIATNPAGTALATASSTGTLIRVWDPNSSRLVKELRRGTDAAEIFAVALRRDGKSLCVSSDKGTVHVWDLTTTRQEKRQQQQQQTDLESESPRRKQFEMMKPYLPKYFSSEWSHSQFRLPPPVPLPPSSSRLPFSLATSSGSDQTGRSSSGPAVLTVEDDVCVCGWIEVLKPVQPEIQTKLSPDVTAAASRRPPMSRPSNRPDSFERRDGSDRPDKGKGKQREYTQEWQQQQLKHEQRQQRRAAANAAANRVSRVPPEMVTEHQIVAVTRSGGWFRVSLDGERIESASSSNPVSSDSTRVRQTSSGRREEPSGVVGLGRDSTSDCRLEEYRRFVSLGDDT